MDSSVVPPQRETRPTIGGQEEPLQLPDAGQQWTDENGEPLPPPVIGGQDVGAITQGGEGYPAEGLDGQAAAAPYAEGQESGFPPAEGYAEAYPAEAEGYAAYAGGQEAAAPYVEGQEAYAPGQEAYAEAYPEGQEAYPTEAYPGQFAAEGYPPAQQ